MYKKIIIKNSFHLIRINNNRRNLYLYNKNDFLVKKSKNNKYLPLSFDIFLFLGFLLI